MRHIAVIGGGAAGLAAAVAAKQEQARSAGPSSAGEKGKAAPETQMPSANSVALTVFEAADRMGKTILASGNGRCNFSNSDIKAASYCNAAFVEKSLQALPPHAVHSFFQQIGLLWHEESEGRLYPLTNKANSVLDVLRYAAECSGVAFMNQKKVCSVSPENGRFLVTAEDGSSSLFDAAIIACGGKVARTILPKEYAFHNTRPLLGPLKTDTHDIRGLDNLRVRCSVSIRDHAERGEILFRAYGISGIAVFNLSRFARPGDRVVIDFLPDTSHPEVESMLAARCEAMKGRSAIMFCAGMLQAPLARALLKKAGVDAKEPFSESAIPAFTEVLKEFGLTVQGIEDPRQCQVNRGGFALETFDPETLQSNIDPGLFVVGEALDVDGPCGGFNLHWAWTSGILAGRATAQIADPR